MLPASILVVANLARVFDDLEIHYVVAARSPARSTGFPAPHRTSTWSPTSSQSVGQKLLEEGNMAKLFFVTDISNGTTEKIEVGAPDIDGWNDLVKGWSISGKSTTAQLKIDEDLGGLQLGIFHASNHMILWGKVVSGAILPEIRRYYGSTWSGEPEVEDGHLYFRFDTYPLRIGRHIIELNSEREAPWRNREPDSVQ